MDIYTGFAAVYDLFMDDIPYRKWAVQTRELLHSHRVFSGIVAELGCGTGSLTGILSELGYDMIGIDISSDMLDIANQKSRAAGQDILYLCQDIREFELYGTCAAIISRCDSLNYITKYRDLVQVFRLVNNYLDPGAPFIFDMNSAYKYERILGNRTIAENRDEGSFIWENEYEAGSRINTYDLTFYVDRGGGNYLRFEERHVQRAYSLEEIRAAADAAGLRWGGAVDADTEKNIQEDTQRYLFTLFEQGKRALSE